MIFKDKNLNKIIETSSALNEDHFTSEIVELERHIFKYRLAYCAIGAYCAFHRGFLVPLGLIVKDGPQERKPDTDMLEFYFTYFHLVITLPWVMKSLFGLIGDIFFPFGYRVKGYCIIASILNICLSITIIFFDRVSQGEKMVFILTFCMIVSISLLDATAQGMTTLTILMQKRLLQKKYPTLTFKRGTSADLLGFALPSGEDGEKLKPSYIKCYAEYLMANYGSTYIYMALGYIMFFYEQKRISCQENINYDSLIRTFKYCVWLCLITSFMLLYSSFKFKELKRTSWFQLPQNTNLCSTLKKIFCNKSSLLFLIVFSMVFNPSNYVGHFLIENFALWNPKTRKLPLYEDIAPIILAGCLTISVLFLLQKWRSNRMGRYIVLIAIAQVLNYVGQALYCISEESSIWRSSKAMLLYITLSFFVGDGASCIMKLCLVDRFLRKSPRNYEVFFVNLLSSIVSIGRATGKILLAYQGTVTTPKLDSKNIDGLEHGLYYNWIWIVVPLIFFLLHVVFEGGDFESSALTLKESLIQDKKTGEFTHETNLENCDGELMFKAEQDHM